LKERKEKKRKIKGIPLYQEKKQKMTPNDIRSMIVLQALSSHLPINNT